MAKKIRYYRPHALVEITNRTVAGQYLLTPGTEFNESLLGVLGRVLSHYRVCLHGISVQSNHYHAILSAADVGHLSGFMRDFNSGVALLVNRNRARSGKVWARRYTSIEILDDEAAIDRIRYLFDQATHHDLVERPRDWPGVHTIDALCRGEQLEGVWIDHDRVTRAARRGKTAPEAIIKYDVPVEPIPAWKNLSIHKIQSRYRAIERKVEQSTAERRARADTRVRPLGPARILAQDPFFVPEPIATSPAPRCHTTRPKLRDKYLQAYREYVDGLRAALTRLIEALPELQFPPDGCQPWHPRRAEPLDGAPDALPSG